VHQRRVMRQAHFFTNGINDADAEAWIGYAVSQGWILEDGDGLLHAGPVSRYLPEPTAEAGRSDHWTHRLFARG
jgi:hypothetical protein